MVVLAFLSCAVVAVACSVDVVGYGDLKKKQASYGSAAEICLNLGMPLC